MMKTAGAEPVLIVVRASRSCELAEKHLKSVGVSFKVVDAEELDVLPSLRRDLDITGLPALLTDERAYVGIDEIRAGFKSGRR